MNTGRGSQHSINQTWPHVLTGYVIPFNTHNLLWSVCLWQQVIKVPDSTVSEKEQLSQVEWKNHRTSTHSWELSGTWVVSFCCHPQIHSLRDITCKQDMTAASNRRDVSHPWTVCEGWEPFPRASRRPPAVSRWPGPAESNHWPGDGMDHHDQFRWIRI